MASPESIAADRWLVPILTDILPPGALGALEPAAGASYWQAAVVANTRQGCQ
jgi:hypothetical protein